MISVFLLVLALYFICKNALELAGHANAMQNNGMSDEQVKFLKISSWMYVPGLIGVMVPTSLLAFILGIVCFMPGVILGRKYSYQLEGSGTDLGVNAGRAISKVMWLGFGVFTLLVANILITAIMTFA